MSSPSTLNSFAPYGQVLMVRAKPWKAHSYDPETGALSEEWIRGLCAVFAKGSGEGVSLTPMLHFLRNALEAGQDDPSPADPVAWNNRAHFAALAWAARNKVRHSVRWKTGARVRRARKLEALRRVRATARLIQRRAEGRTGLQGRPADRTAKGRRAARQEWRSEYIEEKLQQLAPGVEIIKDADGSVHYVGCVDTVLLQMTLETVAVLKKHRHNIEKYHICINFDSNYHRANTLLDDALFYALTVGDFEAIAGCVANLKARKWNKARVLLKLLERQRDAYRAHLARRVKPVARRTRVRRPLYARPRPPTAPLAPPVI